MEWDRGTEGHDDFHGGRGVDFFFGRGGNDWINGGMGNDHLFGQDGDDHIFAERLGSTTTLAWGHDLVVGGNGNDTIDYRKTTSSVELWGDDQTFTGDDPRGKESGDDRIWGGEGADKIHGGLGNDKITGGEGADDLWGGEGLDIFKYASGFGKSGDSNVKFSEADTIHDFNANNGNNPWDKIDLGIKGTESNFDTVHLKFDPNTSPQQDFAAALQLAKLDVVQHAIVGEKVNFVFVENGDDGWLFANNDGLHSGFDVAIKLEGVTDFSLHNLIG